MKTNILLQKLFLIAMTIMSFPICGVSHIINLRDGWTLQGRYKATVPSTIMGVLTANGEYPNILDGMAYKYVDRTRFDCPWTYSTEFSLTEADRSGNVFLQLDGISYRANIRLNGTLVADTSVIYGTYRRHRLNITRLVKADNKLEIEVFRARKGEPNAGYVDWNPRPADESMGLIRPVSIITCGDVIMTSPAVQSEVNVTTLDEAWLTLSTQLENLTDHEIKGELCCSFDGQQFAVPVTLRSGERRLLNITPDAAKALHVSHPRLWWCRGLGKAELYDMRLTFVADGKVYDTCSLRFGIRQVGEFFTSNGDRGFTLNGKRVLVRGGGWTDDIFMCDTKESNAEQLYKVCDMNLNAVRMENIWSKSQDIFDRCDSLGIMLLPGWTCHWEWENYMGIAHDDMYGCMTSEKDIKLLTQYFKDQLLWLRHHPSIICWFVGSDKLPAPELERNYRHLLRRYDSGRPLITSAKKLESQLTGTAGMKMAGPYDYVGPTYWYDKLAPGGAFGFNTETGIGAQMPQKESLIRMMGNAVWPINETWNYHCTASTSSMNKTDRLCKVIQERYGAFTGLDDFLHKADLANYESTRAMFESFRVNTPRATGIIQWMLNSARPGLYWQLYDHYGQPNAAYYSVKKGNAPIQLIYDYAQGNIVAVNSTLTSTTINAHAKLYAIDGSLLFEKNVQVRLGSQSHVNLFTINGIKDNTFLFLEAKDSKGNVIATNDYVLAEHMDKYDWKASDWITTPITRYADYTPLASLTQVKLQAKATATCSADGVIITVDITNPASVVALQARLALTDSNSQLVYPAHYNDNYISLEPGEQRIIRCVIPSLTCVDELSLHVDGWNVDGQEIIIRKQ
ncbi:glycoside hydrolase family 2 protein [Prevotella sp.]|uniref:glycoside hydrolase family 2 protein n=1 Tax=Prevotella sp. TaxID=59823 RepID=UPI0025E18202|nr:glycoside hydrolase family 2 TIM barrel-domain containing protein [Prevotella sp.]